MRALLVTALLAAALVPAAAYDVAGMRDAMLSVFSSMRVLLERSATLDGLAEPQDERAVLAAAQDLADQAAIISEHVPRDEVSFLASSLDRYATWIRRSLEWRRHEAARRLVHDAVEVCIACHTRVPSRRDSPLARDFLDTGQMEGLPAEDRARLQVATRRFDDALHTLEGLLAGTRDPDTFERAAREYLVVALRVKGDPRRARQAFSQLAAGGGVEDARRRRLESWVGALQRLEIDPPVAGDLDTARALVREAETRRDAAVGDPLVLQVAASRLLYEYLDRGEGSVVEGAEAYYLLGLTHYRIEPGAPLPRAELFLEKAVRTAPGSEHARRALALLRVKLTEQYAAAPGAMPPEIVDHLRLLQELVESPG